MNREKMRTFYNKKIIFKDGLVYFGDSYGQKKQGQTAHRSDVIENE